jgi:hypothetical protein
MVIFTIEIWNTQLKFELINLVVSDRLMTKIYITSAFFYIKEKRYVPKQIFLENKILRKFDRGSSGFMFNSLFNF